MSMNKTEELWLEGGGMREVFTDDYVDSLLAELATVTAERDEARMNDRCAMSYLSEIRALVGGNDFPDVVARVAALAKLGAGKTGEIEQDLNKCPSCGGPADNGFSREIPPSPYYCTKCMEKLK